jgi:hypothetical protein
VPGDTAPGDTAPHDAGFALTGRVAVPDAGARRDAPVATISHVMAIDPASAGATRLLAPIAADGSFQLALDTGHPWVLVFVDDSQVGTAMIRGILRAGVLDTVAPADGADGADLAEVDVAADGTATAGISYDALLTALGLDAETAAALGAVDDLSLRYANPDIDGDGVIDVLQDHAYGLDFHLRGNLRAGSDGAWRSVADMVAGFPSPDGEAVATPDFNLASIYALYPATLDTTDYAGQDGLTNGATFDVTLADGSEPAPPTSFSGLQFGDTRGWGPDYAWNVTGTELPGSGGAAATLSFGFGATGTTLTFSHVVTRTRTSLTAQGVLMPFVRFTEADGVLTGIAWEWRARGADGTWALATDQQLTMLVGSQGAYVSLRLAPGLGGECGIAIPLEVAGSEDWSAAWRGNVDSTTFDTLTAEDVCSVAVSYDDTLGMRLFAGGADPAPGVDCHGN